MSYVLGRRWKAARNHAGNSSSADLFVGVKCLKTAPKTLYIVGVVDVVSLGLEKLGEILLEALLLQICLLVLNVSRYSPRLYIFGVIDVAALGLKKIAGNFFFWSA